MNTTESGGATAIHYAAIEGNLEMVRRLLAAGADVSIIDRKHSSTPLGWATWGADYAKKSTGDYPAAIRAIAGAGGRLNENEHVPENAEARAALNAR